MDPTPDSNNVAAPSGAHQLAELNAQIEAARALLARMRQEVAEAESRLKSSQSVQLVEVNEKLVISALQAQTDAEMAARALNEVAHAAQLDALTQLPNRALLLDRFEQAIASAKRHGARLALLFLDVDDFKQINDTLGHAAGDEVLKLVAHRLASSVREVDTVSRHSGDEFVILLAEVFQASDAVLVAAKVIAALNAPCQVGDQVFHLKASIGISIYPDDGEDTAMLIDRADAAMYRAKTDGLGSFVFHHDKVRNDGSPEPAVVKSPQQPIHYYAQALIEHERRHALLREANERLVLSALRAQESQAAAEETQRR